MRHQGARFLSRAQSRVGAPSGKRNFRIFYYLFAGAAAEGRQHMQLLEKTAFRFLGHRDIPPTHAPASTTISTFTAKSASSKLFLHKPIADDLFHCGCLLGGIHSGVKHSRPRHLPLSTPSRSTSATATFTRNAFKAAPVTASKICSRSNRARALVVNSGCTNAVTGQQGLLCHKVSLVKHCPYKILTALRPHGPLTHTLGHGFTAWEAAACVYDDGHLPKVTRVDSPTG